MLGANSFIFVCLLPQPADVRYTHSLFVASYFISSRRVKCFNGKHFCCWQNKCSSGGQVVKRHNVKLFCDMRLLQALLGSLLTLPVCQRDSTTVIHDSQWFWLVKQHLWVKKGDWLWLICLHTSWHRWPSYCNLRRTTCVLFLPSITYYLIRLNVWRMICSSHNVFRSQWESGNSHLLDCNYDQRVFLCSTAWKNWRNMACCRVSKKKY